MNNVAAENVPVELPAVELNESPVFRKSFVAGTDGNRRGVEDVSQDALALCAPEPSDVTVELVDARLQRLRLLQPVLKLLPIGSCLGVLALDGLPQTLKLDLVAVDHEILVANLVIDGLESVLKGPAAELDDLATRHAVVLAVVEFVRIFAGRESNMAGGKEEDPIAPAAFVKIETAGSFEVRESLGSDLETECRSERDAYVGCWVNGGDVVEELRSGKLGEDGLAKRDFDVDNLILQEDLLAAHSRVLGVLGGESPGHDAHPEEKGTGFLFGFGKADRVNTRPLELTGIKVLVDPFT
jgi:hypothetical protein